MSLRHALTSLNTPPVVVTAGAALFSGLTFGGAVTIPASLAAGLNLAAFLINVGAVSVPGRLDGEQDAQMRQGAVNPSKPTATGQGGGESTPLRSTSMDNNYSLARGRTLVSPSGWAFSIWAPIYLGEATFVGSQFLAPAGTWDALLPQIALPFVAANLFQSLWCASFRPSYTNGWHLYVSPLMLAGTAASLSQINLVASSLDSSGLASWLLLPLTMHFGWTTAATLVNLNGSLANTSSASDSLVIAAGHSSALAATAIGVGWTILHATPAYGWTLAWALAACADGMGKRLSNASHDNMSDALRTGAQVQNKLCWLGAAACAASALYVSVV